MTASGVTLHRKDLLLLAALFLAGFALRVYFLQFYDVISADGISYVSIAKDFIAGNGLHGATHYPPLFPILLGLSSVVTRDFEAAGLAVSVIMGSLIVVPIYLLGAEFFNKRVGVIAALLATTWPTLRYWSTAVMSQATYITLLLFGMYFLWRAYRGGILTHSILAGGLFACAHLTRSEGVLVFVAQMAVLLLFSLVNGMNRRGLLCLLLSAAVFALVFSPYFVMLHDLTGKWQLTGKSKITIADALSEYLHQPDIKYDPRFQELGYLDLFRKYPEYIRSNYLKNIAVCWRQMLPWLGWVLAGLGFLVGIRSKKVAAERAFLLASFAPLGVIIVFFFIGPEYTQAYLPVLFLCVGNALVTGSDRLFAAVAAGSSPRAARVVACLPVFAAALYGSWNVVSAVPADRDKPYDFRQDEGRYDEKQVGLKLAKTLPQNAVIMTRSGRVGFYSGHRYVMPPVDDYQGLLACARKNKVDYLIATAQLLAMRPQWAFLFAPLLAPDKPFRPPPELELVTLGQEPGGSPYLVYRFKLR